MKDYVVGKLAEIPDGKSIAVKVGPRTIAVFRIGDEVFAVANSCPHRGASLCEGKVIKSEKVVRCPWHHWNWQLDQGELELDSRQKIRTYNVAIQGDDVILRL